MFLVVHVHKILHIISVSKNNLKLTGFIPMNKTQLAESISEKTGLTKALSLKSIDAFIETVKDELIEGNEVNLIGFGSFKTRHRAERMGRNPQTGAELQIKASIIPAFSAGKGLKDVLKK